MNNLSPYNSAPISIEGIHYSDIIRTGVPGDGSCYFHTIAYALNWKNYVNSTDKTQHIRELRKEFSSQLTLPHLRQSTYYTYIPTWVDNIMLFLRDHPNPTDTEIHMFVQRKYSEHKNLETTICTEDIFRGFTRFLTQQLQSMEHDVDAFQFEDLYLQHIRCTLNIYTYWPDAVSLLPYTADFFHTNLFLVQERDGIVHPVMHSDTRYRKSIVILHINQSHFECIGVMDEGKPTYFLDGSHPLIQQLTEKSAPFMGMSGGFAMGSSVTHPPLTPSILYYLCIAWFILFMVYATQTFVFVYIETTTDSTPPLPPLPQLAFAVNIGFVFLLVWWMYYTVITQHISIASLGCLLIGYTAYQKSIAYIPIKSTQPLPCYYTVYFVLSVLFTICGIGSTLHVFRTRGMRTLSLSQWVHITILTLLFFMYI